MKTLILLTALSAVTPQEQEEARKLNESYWVCMQVVSLGKGAYEAQINCKHLLDIYGKPSDIAKEK